MNLRFLHGNRLYREVSIGPVPVVIGDAVIVGSDDGMSGFDNTSQLYSFDQFTGEVISVIDIVGDQRSSIAYRRNER